ncbi:hypothetical protein D3C81_1983170 [compost metagenome]
MGDQVIITDKLDEVRHHLPARWRLFQHGIADPGILLNKAADVKARIHQRRKTFTDVAVFNPDGANFDRSITLSW